MRDADDHGGHELLTAQLTAALTRVLRDGALAVLVTLVEAPRGIVGAKILLELTGARTCTTGDGALDASISDFIPTFLDSRAEARTVRVEEFAPHLAAWRGARLLFERIEPEPHIVICGAGHVGAALARLAHSINYRVTLIDDRPDFVARARFPEEQIVLVAAASWAGALEGALGTSARGVSVAVVTRGHSEDEECLRAVLATRPDYVGMIGSRRRTNIVLERLRASGFTEESLSEVRAPIGLDIGAVSPEEVALSILAEIVNERRGGSGQSLSKWRRE